MARPRKYTDEEMVAALEQTMGMVYIAAGKVGCDPDTIYLRAKSSKAVQAAINKERGKFLDTCELKLFQAVNNGEPWAVRLALMTLGRDRGYNDNEALNDLKKQVDRLRDEITNFVRNRNPST